MAQALWFEQAALIGLARKSVARFICFSEDLNFEVCETTAVPFRAGPSVSGLRMQRNKGEEWLVNRFLCPF